jgi:hypothetical protein
VVVWGVGWVGCGVWLGGVGCGGVGCVLWWGGGVGCLGVGCVCGVGEGVSLLRSNIPRYALCATLDTYNLKYIYLSIKYFFKDLKLHLVLKK